MIITNSPLHALIDQPRLMTEAVHKSCVSAQVGQARSRISNSNKALVITSTSRKRFGLGGARSLVLD